MSTITTKIKYLGLSLSMWVIYLVVISGPSLSSALERPKGRLSFLFYNFVRF